MFDIVWLIWERWSTKSNLDKRGSCRNGIQISSSKPNHIHKKQKHDKKRTIRPCLSCNILQIMRRSTHSGQGKHHQQYSLHIYIIATHRNKAKQLYNWPCNKGSKQYDLCYSIKMTLIRCAFLNDSLPPKGFPGWSPTSITITYYNKHIIQASELCRGTEIHCSAAVTIHLD